VQFSCVRYWQQWFYALSLLTLSTNKYTHTYCIVQTQVTIGDLSGELHRRKKDMASVILQSQRTAVERSNMRR
jgi:hypothetical protein